MKIDVTIQDRDLRATREQAERFERLGYDAMWTTEVGHCPFLPHAIAAEATTRLGLGTNIAISFVRSPVVTAYTAWDLQRLSGGRFILGLGSQVRAHNERRFSVPWVPPAPKMRELIDCLRAIWDCWQNGTKPAFQGKHYQFTLQTPATNPGPLEHPHIPVYLAAVNPIMCRTAGEVADGIQIHPFHSVSYLEEVIRPAVQEGIARRGRPADAVDLFASLFVVTGRTEAERAASDRLIRERIAYYASTPGYRGVFDHHGWGEVADRLKLMVRENQWDKIADQITDEILHTFAMVGTPEELPGLIRERYLGRVQRLSFTWQPPADRPEAEWREVLDSLRG